MKCALNRCCVNMDHGDGACWIAIGAGVGLLLERLSHRAGRLVVFGETLFRALRESVVAPRDGEHHSFFLWTIARIGRHLRLLGTFAPVRSVPHRIKIWHCCLLRMLSTEHDLGARRSSPLETRWVQVTDAR